MTARACLNGVAALLALSCTLTVPALADEPPLIGEVRRDRAKALTCPCELYSERYASGPVVLIIGHNEEPRVALLTVANQEVVIESAEWSTCGCRKGELLSSKWQSDDVTLTLDLVVEGPGEESCWFAGEMVVSRSDRQERRRIEGACGC